MENYTENPPNATLENLRARQQEAEDQNISVLLCPEETPYYNESE